MYRDFPTCPAHFRTCNVPNKCSASQRNVVCKPICLHAVGETSLIRLCLLSILLHRPLLTISSYTSFPFVFLFVSFFVHHFSIMSLSPSIFAFIRHHFPLSFIFILLIPFLIFPYPLCFSSVHTLSFINLDFLFSSLLIRTLLFFTSFPLPSLFLSLLSILFFVFQFPFVFL
jgi:hypothetical protein